MSSSITCQHCGCSEIDIDQARGDAVCTNCGLVLEDNIIVSEVQFEETGHGGTSAIGQFVSADGKMPSCFSGGFHHGIGKESRLITLQNGKKKIVQLSQQLRLNQHCIDTAFNFFKMAVARKLTKGRKNSHVIAACVYMVCRTEGTPHMLLDFSDIVQVNVYDLGRTFLRLSSALCINIPTIDPCLFIMRFAHKLEFGDKTHEVSMTALRLVQRMKRDWMHTGRRPSGLCGAALLVAARLHDFNRTTKDIIKVVKVCGSTLRKRLTEFGDTPSSRLTLDEFMSIDLEEEQDPPAFKAARRKQKVLQLEEQTQVEEVTQEITELQRQIERALEERHKKLRGRYNNYVNESGEDEHEEVNDLEAEEDTTKRFVTQETIATIKDFLKNDEENSTSLPTFDEKLRPTAASLGLTDSLEDCMKNTQEVEEEEENGELDLTGIDDAELDYYIMTDTEVQRKTNLWTQINAEYLKEMQEKEEREAKEKEEGISKPDKKKRKIAKKKNQAPATTAGEAIEKMLQEKKISSKINYEVLRNLNKISEDKQPVSVERVETANPPICFLEKNEEEVFLNTNSKRLPSIRGFKNKKMKLAVCPIEEPPSTKEVVLEEVVIESDPVQYASAEPDHDEDGADDFYDEDGHVSAAQLFGMRNAVDDDYGEDFYDDS